MATAKGPNFQTVVYGAIGDLTVTESISYQAVYVSDFNSKAFHHYVVHLKKKKILIITRVEGHGRNLDKLFTGHSIPV